MSEPKFLYSEPILSFDFGGCKVELDMELILAID